MTVRSIAFFTNATRPGVRTVALVVYYGAILAGVFTLSGINALSTADFVYQGF